MHIYQSVIACLLIFFSSLPIYVSDGTEHNIWNFWIKHIDASLSVRFPALCATVLFFLYREKRGLTMSVHKPPLTRMSQSDWVVYMEGRLPHIDPSVEKKLWMKPSIYRVPERIKSLARSQAYRPQLVSLGPFHHGERDLLPMEEHKNRAVLHLVKRSGKQVKDFFNAIKDVSYELMEAYDNLDVKWGSGDGFVEMMLRDGCFLLEVMRTSNLVQSGKRLKDYASNDPIFGIHGFYFLNSEIITDMILIENQLPLLVLKKILVLQDASLENYDLEINKKVLRFLDRKLHEEIDILGLHPLDLFHKSFCGLPPELGSLDEGVDTMPSAVELREARIRFKKSNNGSVCDIDFKNGVLKMPLITVHDEAEKIFLNLIAFERLHTHARHDVTDYIIFMDNIINSERDVALLRSKGLIKSGLGSDKEVADLFNDLSKGAVMSPYCKLLEVQQKMHAHCQKPWNKWWAIFEQTYLRNPWVFLSLVAAIILLAATIMQTIYAVLPFYKK